MLFSLSFQILRNLPADLKQGDFTHFRIILGGKNALLGIEQALLGFAHLDSRQVAQEITVFGYLMILLGRNQILTLQAQKAEVIFNQTL